MGMKIKDLLDIIKESQRREEELEDLKCKYTYLDELGHFDCDLEGFKAEFDLMKRRYDEWANSDLSVLFGDPTENKACIVDDATHATNVYIMKRLGKYLDENPQIRFGQALMNLNILEPINIGTVKDPYFDKSNRILERMKGRLEHEENKKTF